MDKRNPDELDDAVMNADDTGMVRTQHAIIEEDIEEDLPDDESDEDEEKP